MTWIILAAWLGANILVVTLLFRRLRGDLNRQLRDIRAEHNSETILRALKDAPEERQQAAQAANGEVYEPPTGPSPVRRKKHLGLYIGGGLAALGVTVSHVAREAWQSHRAQLVASVIGATAAASTTVTLLTLTPWQDSTDNHPPSSAPTAVPTVTLPPGYTQPPPSGTTPSATPSPTASGPEPSTSPTPSASASPTATPSLVPVLDEPKPTVTPSPSEETPPPGSEPPPTTPEPEPTPPAEPPPAEPPAEEPANPPATSALCAGLAVTPLFSIEACLLGGGA